MNKILTLATLILVQNSYALELQGTDGVEIMAINGQEVDSALFSNHKAPDIEAGEHQIVVRFAKEFYAEQEVRSRPSIFTIDLQQDTQISVDYFSTENKAQRAITKGLEWKIISKDRTYSIKDSDILIDKGFLPYSNIEDVIERYNQQKVISKVVNATTISNMKPMPSAINTSTTIKTEAGNENIRTLYQQLSMQDKKQFRIWLIEQEMN